VWRVAGRTYDDLFLKHDVMFCGPGRYGPFDEEVYQDVIDRDEFTSRKIGQVRQFANEVQAGDVVLLRLGHHVKAVGLAAEDGYEHNSTFDDVYGWDLEHTRRVIWQHQLTDELDQRQADGGLFGGRMPTFTGVNDESVVDPVQHLFDRCEQRELTDLPQPPSKPMSMAELEQALFRKGLPYDAALRVRQTIEKLRQLIDWYRLSHLAPDRPAEHEIVAHVILPLLKALGWSEQLLAVEWHKIDLAVFWKTPTDERHCKLVCEAKVIGHGLQDVLAQAERYVSTFDLDECDKILVTDVQRFYVYERTGDAWTDQPVGYLNLFKIRECHVCPVNTDAVDTIMSLTPARVARQ